jgi:hypothetical protein
MIGGHLYQFPSPESPVPNEDFTADLVLEGNHIQLLKPAGILTEDGIVATNTLRVTISNNTVQAEATGSTARSAIGAGGITGPVGFAIQFPGSCTLNSNRFCLSNFDCKIPSFDTDSQGTCSLPSTQPVFWITRDLTIENNEISGSFPAGLGNSAINGIVQGNKIIGPLAPGTRAGIIIAGKHALETIVVTRNIVKNVSTALRIDKLFQGLAPSYFGAKISLNDFTGYTTAIRTSNDYDLSDTILTVDGMGNFWGLDGCTLGGFDPNSVKRDNGTINPNVIDSHPYGEPVAEIPEEDLPMTCF